jgi:phosphoglycolate phosphatase
LVGVGRRSESRVNDTAVETTVPILFDLDGTLTDPRVGIVRCLKYALQALGCPSPSYDQLARYIGPPLHESLAVLLNSRNAELIGQAVYPGIELVLVELQKHHAPLYVVTAKPTVFAQQILAQFGLSRFFSNIYGSELDGTRSRKEDLIAHVLAEERIPASWAVMVGDREHDIKGALTNGVMPVGTLWGYGSRAELIEAGASLLCERPEALVEVLAAHTAVRALS